MDYPHPLEALNADGTIDLSNAYPQRIGDWDKVTIDYGYRRSCAAGTDSSTPLASRRFSTTRGARISGT